MVILKRLFVVDTHEAFFACINKIKSHRRDEYLSRTQKWSCGASNILVIQMLFKPNCSRWAIHRRLQRSSKQLRKCSLVLIFLFSLEVTTSPDEFVFTETFVRKFSSCMTRARRQHRLQSLPETTRPPAQRWSCKGCKVSVDLFYLPSFHRIRCFIFNGLFPI